MKNEFILAFNEVIEEKQLPKEVILQALESAMVHAYRRSVNASTAQHVEAKIDPETGKAVIYAEKEVVDSVQDERTEVTLEVAQKVDPSAEYGSMVIVESTPSDFGRVAAQTARQVIQQRIRDAEREAQLDYYSKQLGEIVSGIVQAANAQGLTIGLELRAEGMLYRKEMIPGERFRIHDRVRALVIEAKDSNKGPQILLSRTHRDFLRRLLENEVPEIYHGIVEVRSIAREPGERAKVAVSATQSGIDPVGACVGIRGVRIQAIVRELHDEKIDVIEWNPDPVAFIAKAISPARVTGVYLNEKNSKTATVVVPEDQLSLAIGRDGQNARLAAKLTGWRIDIKSLSEATGDSVNRLQTDPALVNIAESERKTLDQVSELLAKKAEGRPLTAEEYDMMAQFINRVEKRVAVEQKPEPVSEQVVELDPVQKLVPETVRSQNLLDTELPEHVTNILQEAGFITTGDLLYQVQHNIDTIFRLQGIGPRAMEAIQNFTEKLIPRTVEETASVETEITGEPEPVTEAQAEIGEQVLEVEEGRLEEETDLLTDAEMFRAADEESSLVAEEQEVVEEIAAISETLAVETPTQEEEILPDEESDLSFEELFRLRPSVLPEETVEDEEESEVSDSSQPKKKKKKRRFTEIEYDPEADRTVVRKKHKRGEDEWELG